MSNTIAENIRIFTLDGGSDICRVFSFSFYVYIEHMAVLHTCDGKTFSDKYFENMSENSKDVFRFA